MYTKIVKSACLLLCICTIIGLVGCKNMSTTGNSTESIGVSENLDDFVIEGTVIYGFSQSGCENLKNNSSVTLPRYNSNGQQIKRIAAFAFNPNKESEIKELDEKLDVDGFDIKNLGKGFNENYLKSITIPDGYETIGQDAFTWNKALEECRIPDTVQLISEYSFAHTKLKKLTLPQSLKTLNDCAFFDANIEGELVLPPDVSHIGERAFKMNHLTNVVFKGNNITVIPEEAFTDNRLETIVLPSSIKTVHSEAFFGNKGVREYGYVVVLRTQDSSAAIPDGKGFFVNPSETKKVSTDKIDFSRWDAADFTYDGTTVTGFSGLGFMKIKENQELNIPEKTTDGKLVTKIGKDAFRNVDFGNSSYQKYDLKKVTLPLSIEEIDDYAFQSNNIKEIIFGSEKNMNEIALQRIGQGAFMNNKLERLDFLGDGTATKLTVIDNAAFHINFLEMVFIPESVEKIGFSAFRENQISMLFFMPGSKLSEIKEMAFLSNKIQQLDLSNTKLTVIPEQCFANNAIAEVTFPDILKTIEHEAFALNQLKQGELPNSVEKIAFNAFNDNPQVVSLTTKNKNAHRLADGENYVIDNADGATDTEKKEIETLLEEIKKLDKTHLRESTKRQYADIEVSGAALLKNNHLSKAAALKFVQDSKWFISRITLDRNLNMGLQAIALHNANEPDVKLLREKCDYAVIAYNNAAVTGKKLTRLETELSRLTDLVNRTNEIAETTRISGHYKLKTSLPIPAYHIGVYVYFKKDGTIYYVLDRSYSIGAGTKNEYGKELENVDEDNAGYHELAIATLSDYEGLHYDDVIQGSVDNVRGKVIEKIEKATEHRAGLYQAIKDACEDYKKTK